MKQHILSHIAARKAPPGRYADGAGLWLHKREGAGRARQCATQVADEPLWSVVNVRRIPIR